MVIRMRRRSCTFDQLLIIMCIALLSVLVVQKSEVVVSAEGGDGFVRTRGAHFELNERLFFVNGFNAYWMMETASDPSQRYKVSSVLDQASRHGLTLARTWAFSDGGGYNKALQISPASYNENMFKGLDFVISEARKHGIHLILSLVNNYNSYGGRPQYVEWAREHGGQSLSSDDDFYTNPIVKGYYKNHIKTVLTRVNSFTGIAYKDDPTIFAWELMNEPRCQNDLSGRTIQGWVVEMSSYVKSIDSNHMLEVGLEGFYGESMPEKKQFNPGYEVGSDFISNNQLPQIDFATIHAYPDQWLQGGINEDGQVSFLNNWLRSHIQDAKYVLNKPLLCTEFGKSSKDSGFTPAQRDDFFATVYNNIDSSARSGGAAAGALFWQLFADGMDSMRDGYEIMLDEDTAIANMITQQSHKLSVLSNRPLRSNKRMTRKIFH